MPQLGPAPSARHVHDGLEKETAPLQIHVEAAITKGKYDDYDTFTAALMQTLRNMRGIRHAS
jgi:hypothetical protein